MDTRSQESVPETGNAHSRIERMLHSKHAGWWLGVISFTESLFAPILIDPFLVALIFAKREAWIRYIGISVIFSVLGGIAGYLLGLLFYDTIGKPILEIYNLTANFDAFAQEIDTNGFVFVLLGALTPVPYKLIAIASGLFKMNFVTFLFASVVGRFLRLGLVGLAAYAAGPHALPLIRKHLLLFAYAIGAVLIAYIVLQFV